MVRSAANHQGIVKEFHSVWRVVNLLKLLKFKFSRPGKSWNQAKVLGSPNCVTQSMLYENLTCLISTRLNSPGKTQKMDINGPGKKIAHRKVLKSHRRPLLEILHHTQLMTVVLSPTLVSDDYTPQRDGHASLPGPTVPLVTRAFCFSVLSGYCFWGYRYSATTTTTFATASPGLWNSIPSHFKRC